jgi:hypothetical protein
MESRFGRDFSKVRVHADLKAAESARAVNALAYTVGRDVVFGAGQYTPSTREGRQLLAHELAHVLQQRQSTPSTFSLQVGPAHDSYEAEAERTARMALSTDGAAPHGSRVMTTLTAPTRIQRAREDSRESPTTPTPPPPSTEPEEGGFVCGPNVTKQVRDAVSRTQSKFVGWSSGDKTAACQALTSWQTGDLAWDIGQLHSQRWILDYQPACASDGAEPKCIASVQIDNDCHYAGSVNYVIFGIMCKLCYNHFTALGSSNANDYTEAEMLNLIDLYKGTGPLGLSTPSANFGPSREWSKAGYHGWPATASPAGDRSNCSPTCPTPYKGMRFIINWVPKGWF